MGYEMQLNDPVFYDDTWFINCDDCGGEFDRNTYDSVVCEECENKSVKRESTTHKHKWNEMTCSCCAWCPECDAESYKGEIIKEGNTNE